MTKYVEKDPMNKVKKITKSLISEIKNFYPEANIIVSDKTFEDEDILLFVYVHNDIIDKVRKFLHETTLDILLEQDIDIAFLVRSLEKLKSNDYRFATSVFRIYRMLKTILFKVYSHKYRCVL